MKQRRALKNRTRRGVTLVETMFSVGMTSVVMLAALSLLVFGLVSWTRGQGRIDVEWASQAAVRTISKEIREAMAVTVDADGRGVTYRLPQYTAGGGYVIPMTWDGISRRIEITADGRCVMYGTGYSMTLCNNVILTDPRASNAAYRPFVPGNGTVTRSINLMLVTRANVDRGQTVTNRSRETIFLRNIPDLYR